MRIRHLLRYPASFRQVPVRLMDPTADVGRARIRVVGFRLDQRHGSRGSTAVQNLSGEHPNPK